jgi:tetratricopeptide (TPR) repeat protein
MYLGILGIVLETSFRCTGESADLDQAITSYAEAAAATPVSHPARLGSLVRLGEALRTRFGRTEQLTDLDEVITWFGEAVEAAPADYPDRPLYLTELGAALQGRFERTGQLADLDQAIASYGAAVAATPADHIGWSVYLSSLGGALMARFRHVGDPADLDQAITRFTDAVAGAPADQPFRPIYLLSLGSALHNRFERGGQQADLDQAITCCQQAVAAIPPGHPDRPRCLSGAGIALRTRFERDGQRADLDQAITYCQQAVAAAPPGHPDRPHCLSALATALLTRFQRGEDPADLDQAITRLNDAVAATPTDHADRYMFLSNLGIALRTRFDRGGQRADLDQAIAHLREVVAALPADHPDRSTYLNNLGGLLEIRFGDSGQKPDLELAIAAFREGAGVLTASPRSRLTSARAWGQCAMQAGDAAAALEGYTAAVELLPLVAWHGLDQSSRGLHLRYWLGLAADAASAAVAAGQPVRAVELLEAGRSVLWTQALNLRQDLSALRERAPELAAALEASRTVLAGPATSPALDLAAPGGGSPAYTAVFDQRRQAARDWDAAVAMVRDIPGWEYFMRPVPLDDLRVGVDAGPVVVVNISSHGSHALIVTQAADPPVLVVDLPDAPIDTVIHQAGVVNAAAHAAPDAHAGLYRQALFDSLEWCWQAIAEPVLTVLGHTRTPQARIEEWPRVWWCLAGPATRLLPLHAAGRHPRTAAQYTATGEAAAIADTVAGRVLSSYTQSLTALARAHVRPAPGQTRQLAVGVSQALPYVPGLSALPAVPAELQVLAGYLPPPGQATHLLDQAATRQAVLDALPRHPWLHLSCHATQSDDDAWLSGFYLYDQPLTLADLAALGLGHNEADLAFLSACQTATGDVQLPDESLHLAAAMQLIGYRHVLATLWSVADSAAPALADTIYAHLRHPGPDGPPQADRAPYALHHAVTRLRQDDPDEPLLWAPYIHLGR